MESHLKPRYCSSVTEEERTMIDGKNVEWWKSSGLAALEWVAEGTGQNRCLVLRGLKTRVVVFKCVIAELQSMGDVAIHNAIIDFASKYKR